jgi:hypothetical protein
MQSPTSPWSITKAITSVNSKKGVGLTGFPLGENSGLKPLTKSADQLLAVLTEEGHLELKMGHQVVPFLLLTVFSPIREDIIRKMVQLTPFG